MTRRLTAAVLLSGIVLAPEACKRTTSHSQAGNRDEPLLSVLAMDDPRADAQLLRGVYPPESGPWRWVAGKFTVILRPPAGAAQFGARLELKLNIPDVIHQQLGALTLSAEAAGMPLGAETFPDAGDHVYTRNLPASALGGDSLPVDFSTDKAIPAGKIEKRELALIVTSVGLVLK